MTLDRTKLGNCMCSKEKEIEAIQRDLSKLDKCYAVMSINLTNLANSVEDMSEKIVFIHQKFFIQNNGEQPLADQIRSNTKHRKEFEVFEVEKKKADIQGKVQFSNNTKIAWLTGLISLLVALFMLYHHFGGSQ